MMMEPSSGFIRVMGHNIYYRSFGTPDVGTVLALSGGPFGTHDALLPIADLVQFGYRVVMYDYLGCGKSDRPKGAEHYSQDRAVDEVEGVRRALRLGRVHLVGVSYGGELALDVALKRPESVRSLVVSSSSPSWSLKIAEWDRVWSSLPKNIRDTIEKHEAKGDINNPKYTAALNVWIRRHICRLSVMPYDLWYFLGRGAEKSPLNDLPNRLEGWDITDRLSEIRLPCLVTVGKFDPITPKCARAIHKGIRGSELVMFEKCSHTALWEDRAHYIEVLRDYLGGVSASPRKRP